MARKAFAATLTSSAVGKSVTITGTPSASIGRVDLAQRPSSARSDVHAEDEPVRVQRVLDGEALAQELGVPGQLDVLAGRGQPGQPLGEPLRGADRDGRLADDQAGPRVRRGASASTAAST